MTNRKIRMGVMGCANIADRSLIPAFKNHPDFELVAVASRSAEKAECFSKKFSCKPINSYDNLLAENIDAVYLPLPTGLHKEWVAKCLIAGKHVFVEKSFGMNYEDTKGLLDLARANKLIAMENFMFPHHSQHKFLLQLIQNGSLGAIRDFKASFGFPPLQENNFRYNVEVGGGALLDAAAYTIKATLATLGKDIAFLSATMSIDPVLGVDISGSAHFIFNEQIPVQLSWGFDNFYQCGLEIWGSKGKIITNRTFTAGIGFQPTITLEISGEKKEYLLPADNHFHNILTVFAAAINNNEYLKAAEEVELQSKLLNDVFMNAKRYEFKK